MKCEECLPRIEEYVDGELDGRTTERVAAHLLTCAACSSELAKLQREQEIYANYQRDINVTPAQWNIVQARIEQEKDVPSLEPRTRLLDKLRKLLNSRKQFRPAFVAALVLLVIGVTAAVIYLNSRNRQTELVQTPKPSEAQSPTVVVKQDSSSESNQSNERVASKGNQDGSNSNRQTEVLTKSAATTGRQKKVAVVASLPRSQKSVVKQAVVPDESAQYEMAAASNNMMSGMRRNASGATGDFDFEIARHAERAEVLLRSFRNVRLPANHRALDVSYEKENARKLLYQNIALRRDAATRGDEPATEVLNTLEPILLDIANLPNRAKARDVRSIERHMEKKEIVATLQVRTLVASN
jgi:Putative zinc-finger